jgi:hypothetical protein
MPLLDLFFAMFWFFIWIAWIWLVITVFVDIFRSSDLSGLSKALWAIFVLIVPFLGVFIYLIARGGQMSERADAQAVANNEARQQYVRDAASGGSSTAGELEKLVTLRDNGVLSDDEFAAQKAKLLS